MYLSELPLVSQSADRVSARLHGKTSGGAGLSPNGIESAHSICVRAPSRLEFDLGQKFDLLTCQVALCEASFGKNKYPTATFQVLADGVAAATASNVHDTKPRKIIANIQGAKRLELRVTRPAQEICHCAWLDAKVEPWPAQGLLDPVGQVRIHRPETPIVADRCIVTMASPGFARWLDIFLNSLKENGGCGNAAIVVFRVDEDPDCDAVIAAHGAHVVPCTALVPRSATIRPAVFTIGVAARYRSAIIAETDIIVLQDISALFSAVDVCADPLLLVAREQHRNVPYRLDEFFESGFVGAPADLGRFGVTDQERAYSLQINGGLIAGSAEAVALLDNTMRDLLPYSRRWVQSRRDLPAREMFLINLAMARLNSALRIDPSYNVQLYKGSEAMVRRSDPPHIEFRGAPARLLHFNDRKGAYAAAQFRYWRNGNPQVLLAEGLELIRGSSLRQLRSIEYVADLLRKIGLQHTPDGQSLYGDDIRHMNSGPGLLQIPLQLARALVWLSDKKISSYAEVGVSCGWTFSVVTAYLSRFTRLKRSIAIDTVDRFVALVHVQQSYRIQFHRGTTAQLAGQGFDLVFIDADHSYGAAQQDWLRLGMHARICMFHDINDRLVVNASRTNTVLNLWSELRCRYPARVEFLDSTGDEKAMGIGILCLKPTV